MLTRRHIRIKVMQTLYAISGEGDVSVVKAQDLLENNVTLFQGLYLSLLGFCCELLDLSKQMSQINENKYLSEKNQASPKKIANNLFLEHFCKNLPPKKRLKKEHCVNWGLESHYTRLVYNAILKSDFYSNYISKGKTTFEQDKDFFIELYYQVIAPNEKLLECLENHCISWVGDFPFANTILLKKMIETNHDSPYESAVKSVFKNKSDQLFTQELLSKTLENANQCDKIISEKAINWDAKRIAKLDIIILKMALSEAIHIDSIPIRATMNEYVEISKEYSTPKSSVFINGILDKTLKELEENNSLKKSISS